MKQKQLVLRTIDCVNQVTLKAEPFDATDDNIEACIELCEMAVGDNIENFKLKVNGGLVYLSNSILQKSTISIEDVE